MFLKRVKAHAERREPSTLLLKHFLQFADLGKNKNQSGRFNVYVQFFLSQPIGSSVFRVRQYYSIPQ